VFRTSYVPVLGFKNCTEFNFGFVLLACETWSLILREEHGLKLPE
jgi:hypothetical protein